MIMRGYDLPCYNYRICSLEALKVSKSEKGALLPTKQNNKGKNGR